MNSDYIDHNYKYNWTMTDEIPYDLLQVLIAAVETRSFLEAAKYLSLSQAAVSVKLKRL